MQNQSESKQNNDSPHTYFSVSDFYKEKFGGKVYKLSLSVSHTCPNRDGTKSSGGCTFCSAGGSGEFAENISGPRDIPLALEKAKARVRSKMPSSQKNAPQRYIAYFQSFTSTYECGTDESERTKEYERLTGIFSETLKAPEITGIAIATRPDSLSQRMLSFLAELSSHTYVQLEFGLQTSSDATAQKINRAYSTSEYDEALARVKEAAPGIHVVTHIIFGLPGETEDDMMHSVLHAVECRTDGIKITCLHILRGTKLEKEYLSGKIRTLEMYEYFSLLRHALKLIPRHTVIHRLTGDGDKKILAAPVWTADKKRVLNEMKKILNGAQ